MQMGGSLMAAVNRRWLAVNWWSLVVNRCTRYQLLVDQVVPIQTWGAPFCCRSKSESPVWRWHQ